MASVCEILQLNYQRHRPPPPPHPPSPHHWHCYNNICRSQVQFSGFGCQVKLGFIACCWLMYYWFQSKAAGSLSNVLHCGEKIDIFVRRPVCFRISHGVWPQAQLVSVSALCICFWYPESSNMGEKNCFSFASLLFMLLASTSLVQLREVEHFMIHF